MWPFKDKVDEADWGRWVTHYGGPRLSPYAQAIANEYDHAVPFWRTVPFHLTGSSTERRYVVSNPNQYDTLIIGAHINGFDENNGDSGQQVYLNVWDNRTKLPWVTPSPIGWAPLTAYGGVDLNAMPILKLPEAYFLPRGVELVQSIFNFTDIQATNGSITWVGVELVNFDGRCAPLDVTLANGHKVRIGARQPLFMPLPLGRETFSAGVVQLQINAGSNYIQYTAPLDCDAEIHDVASADLFSQLGQTLDPDHLLIKITDMGDRDMWRPDRAPSTGVVGDFTQIYPALPFNKPYTLKKGHRLQVSVQNNIPSTALTNVVATIRGVRLCEY